MAATVFAKTKNYLNIQLFKHPHFLMTATLLGAVLIVGYFVTMLQKQQEIDDLQERTKIISEFSIDAEYLFNKSAIKDRSLNGSKEIETLRDHLHYLSTISPEMTQELKETLRKVDTFTRLRFSDNTESQALTDITNSLKQDIWFIYRSALEDSRKSLLLQQQLQMEFTIWFALVIAGILLVSWYAFQRKKEEARSAYNRSEQKKREAEYIYAKTIKERNLTGWTEFTIDPSTHLPNRAALAAFPSDYHISLFDIRHFSGISQAFKQSLSEDILIDFFVKVVHTIDDDRLKVYRYDIDIAAVVSSSNDIGYDDFCTLVMRMNSELSFYIYDFAEIDGDKIPISVAAGVAYASNGHQISNAELALSEAKDKKVPLVFFDHKDYHDEAVNYRVLSKHACLFQEAYDKSLIIPHFQPIVDIKTKEVVKYEALARIIHPDEQRIVYPGDFLSGTYYFGLGPKMTESVFEQAWEIAKDFDITFNISISDIDSKSLCEKLVLHLSHDPQRAKRFTFEIVETENLSDSKRMSEFIGLIKSLGSKIAIDDFGSGYSNFERIVSDWNADIIKIDGSIIKRIAVDNVAKSSVSAIVQIAKQSGMTTVAEYVSDQEIYNCVKECGVDYAQGYYFGMAVSAKDILNKEYAVA